MSGVSRMAISASRSVAKTKVLKEFLTLFPATLELTLFAMLFAILGIPAGVIAAVKRGGFYDQALMGDRAHRLFDADLLVGPAAHPLRLRAARTAPVSGRIDLINYSFDAGHRLHADRRLLSGQEGAFLDALAHLILPTIVLGTIPLAVIARMTRSAMLEVLSEDYVRTARAKGLSPARVIGLHALRNALIPVVTVIGLQIGTLLAGAVLTETIFSWPGVGNWLHRVRSAGATIPRCRAASC